MPKLKVSIPDLIQSGEYLDPAYDDDKLTMAGLRNLLNYHGVDYSACRTRPELLQLFNSQVRHRDVLLPSAAVTGAGDGSPRIASNTPPLSRGVSIFFMLLVSPLR